MIHPKVINAIAAKYKLKDRDYGKNFEINIDSYCDKWNIHKNDLEKELRNFTEEELKKVCSIFSLIPKVNEADFKETLLNDAKTSILFYCGIKLTLSNPKTTITVSYYAVIFSCPRGFAVQKETAPAAMSFFSSTLGYI